MSYRFSTPARQQRIRYSLLKIVDGEIKPTGSGVFRDLMPWVYIICCPQNLI